MPLISVVVAVKNGGKTLARCLESLAAQTYKPTEIIVINDGSADNTADIVIEFAVRRDNVYILTTNGVGPSKARNLGIGHAKGAYIAFTDGDCICAPDWLTKLAECIVSAPRIAGVGGDQQSPDDDTAYGKFINNFLKTIGFIADYVKDDGVSGCVNVKHNPTCNVLYRRAIFDEVGDFAVGLWPGEDVDLDHRIIKAGYQLRYAPEAVVKHYRPSTLRSFTKMMYRYGHAQAKLVRMHGMFRLIHYVPVAILFAIIASLYLLKNGLLSLLLAFCITAAIFAIIYFIYKTEDIKVSLRYFFHLAAVVVWWNVGFIVGLTYSQKLATKRTIK